MKNRKISALETAIISILSLCLLIYELGFCNWNALANKTYNFSLFRTIIYIVCIILYSKFSKSFIEEAEKVIKYKKKLIIVYSINLFKNGAYRARTYDPLLVRQMLSQLSYDPMII